MTPVQKQFEAVKAAYPGAVLTPNPDGTFTVFIPSMKLAGQWNRSTADVWFLIPVGFPGAKPDCFWTTGGLKLKNGNPPQNTGANPLPFGQAGLLWFSWHVATWSPLSDTILTYVHVIEGRLRDPR
jgi:hypothetical protein